MGVYTRADSPWFWLYLERPDGARGVKEPTRIPHAGATAVERKHQRKLAENAYRVRMAEIARGTYELPGARPPITFTAYADWYEAHISVHQAGHQRETEILAQLRTAFGSTLLSDLTKAQVREWMTRRSKVTRSRTVGDQTIERRLSVSTVNRELDVLKSMLREACPTYLKASPIVGLRRLSPPKADADDDADVADLRLLQASEDARLLDALFDPRDRALILAALDTLGRLSALLALKWTDDKGTYLVFRRAKNRKPYKVPISTRLRAALDALPESETGHIFAHRRSAKNPQLWRTVIKNALSRACVRAGLPYGRPDGLTFHSLRHTGASRMIAAGVDLRTVQELGGWSDIRQLMRYVHPTAAAKRQAVEAVAATGT